MDPDIEIMHVVNVGELKPSSLLIVNLSPEYNRKVPCLDLSNCLEHTKTPDKLMSMIRNDVDDDEGRFDQIDVIWNDRVRQNPKLFNGTKFRVHDVTNSDEDEKHVVLFLGVTDYKEYLGTNWAPNVKELQLKGTELHKNSQAFLSDALGVGASVITKDNFLILLWRSEHCAEAPATWDVPGGHAEPKKIVGDKPLREIDVLTMDKKAVVDEIFDSIVQEVVDEVNIPHEYLGEPLYSGTHRNTTSGGRPSLAFEIRCSLSSDEIRALYNKGDHLEADESTNITFVPLDEIATLDTTRPDLWKKMAPSAKGNLTIFALAYGFKSL